VVAGFSQQLGIFIAALDANLGANTAEIDKSCVNQIKGWGGDGACPQTGSFLNFLIPFAVSRVGFVVCFSSR
jgi:hypothetical protein